MDRSAAQAVLDAFDGDVDAWTPAEVDQRLRVVAGLLRDGVGRMTEAAERLTAAKAAAGAAYDAALLRSYSEHAGDRGWPTARHEATARTAARCELDEATAAELLERSARHAVGAWEAILGVLRSMMVTARGFG